MAEHHMETFSPVMPDQPLTPQHGLHFELELVRRHLDVLVLEGAISCFPASVAQARGRQNRIARELHGELDSDAANDLIIERIRLAQLERQLDHVKKQALCVLPKSQPSVQFSNPPVTNAPQQTEEMVERIHRLLNSDNQFAFDSSEPNPKYVARLTEATLLLGDLSGYRLRIVGHTDSLGQKEHNQKLSLGRARKIADYLEKLGVDSGRIQIEAVGSKSPLFNGDEAHVRLVNRRVSIELIGLPNLVQVIEK